MYFDFYSNIKSKLTLTFNPRFLYIISILPTNR
nr:MAG TPA: hypothetical protein [Caudoviricetes sp.]